MSAENAHGYVSSRQQWDGKGLIKVQSGLITSINGTVRGLAFVAPCDATIISFLTDINAVFTNAAATLAFGTIADAQGDDLLNDIDITDVALGAVEYIADPLWVSKALVKGQTYAVAVTNADTTGSLAVSLIASPFGPS